MLRGERWERSLVREYASNDNEMLVAANLFPVKSAKKILKKIEEKQKQVDTRSSENRTFPRDKKQAKKTFFRATNCSGLD